MNAYFEAIIEGLKNSRQNWTVEPSVGPQIFMTYFRVSALYVKCLIGWNDITKVVCVSYSSNSARKQGRMLSWQAESVAADSAKIIDLVTQFDDQAELFQSTNG